MPAKNPSRAATTTTSSAATSSMTTAPIPSSIPGRRPHSSPPPANLRRTPHDHSYPLSRPGDSPDGRRRGSPDRLSHVSRPSRQLSRLPGLWHTAPLRSMLPFARPQGRPVPSLRRLGLHRWLQGLWGIASTAELTRALAPDSRKLFPKEGSFGNHICTYSNLARRWRLL